MPNVVESGTPVRGIPADGMATGQVDVGTSATPIVGARVGRRQLLLINHGNTDVFYGDSAVTPTTGTLLAGAKGQGVVIPTSLALYGIVTLGAQKISFLELY